MTVRMNLKNCGVTDGNSKKELTWRTRIKTFDLNMMN